MKRKPQRHDADQFEFVFFPPEGAVVTWSSRAGELSKVRGVVISKAEYCRHHFKPGTEEPTEWPDSWNDCLPIRVIWTADPNCLGAEIRVVIAAALTWER